MSNNSLLTQEHYHWEILSCCNMTYLGAQVGLGFSLMSHEVGLVRCSSPRHVFGGFSFNLSDRDTKFSHKQGDCDLTEKSNLHKFFF